MSEQTNTPRVDAAMLLEREGITHPELCETYIAWTDYWALGQRARDLERELSAAEARAQALEAALRELVRLKDLKDKIDAHPSESWKARKEPWSIAEHEYAARQPAAWSAARALLKERGE